MFSVEWSIVPRLLRLCKCEINLKCFRKPPSNLLLHLTAMWITVNCLISVTLNVRDFEVWTVSRRITFAISNFASCMYKYQYMAILENVNSQCLTFAILAVYNIDSSRYKFTALVPAVPLPSAVFFKTHNRPGHCSIGCIDSSTLGSDGLGNRVCSSNIRVCNALMKGDLYYFDVSCKQG